MWNRPVVVALVVAFVSPSVARSAPADPPASPRLAALAAKVAAKQRGAEDAFWKQVADEGTPLIEDTHDAKGRLLVTFLYRARPDTRVVAMYGAPDGAAVGYAQLKRLPGTGVLAHSALVDPAARFSYLFAPGDDFGPPGAEADFEKRGRLFRPDGLNKHPYDTSSLVELPKAPAQPWLVPHRETPTGSLVRFQAKSKALGNERQVLVYAPPDFQPKGPKYPLVVMFDGPTAVMNLSIPIVLDELIAAKKIPPVVVLLVDNADRGKELPGNPAFADFVALDLVPWVRRSYNASDDPRLTVVAGISYGGIASAYAAERHPEVYGNVLSQSGSYWWGPDDADGAAHAHDYATKPRLPLRFWMEVGVFESGSPKPGYHQLIANRHMRDVLLAHGYDVSYREFQGAHEYINWRGTIADGLIALLARPPVFSVKPPPAIGTPGGVELSEGKPAFIARIQRAAFLDGGAAAVAWLQTQDAALASEADVNEIGYALLAHQRDKDAIALFEWNVQRFPNSWNDHDSLADGYRHAGDRARSIASYKRSLELNPKNDNAKQMIETMR